MCLAPQPSARSKPHSRPSSKCRRVAAAAGGLAPGPVAAREPGAWGCGRRRLPGAHRAPADRSQRGGECELVGVRTVGEALDALLQRPPEFTIYNLQFTKNTVRLA